MNSRQVERIFLLGDVLVTMIAMFVSYALRENLAIFLRDLKAPAPEWDYVRLMLIYLPTWAWCASRTNLYRIELLNRPLFESIRALIVTQAWGTAALAMALVVTRVALNRSFLALFVVVSTVLLLLTILVERTWLRASRGRNLALVVGPRDGDVAGELERLRGTLVEWLDSIDPAVLRSRLAEGGADEVILPAAIPRARLPELLRVCDEVGIPARIRMDRVEPDLPQPRAELVGPTLYLLYQKARPDRPGLLLKALLDRVVAAGGLAVLAPLMVVIAILVRATSRGRALFVQERGGLNGRAFRMLKFRTMRADAEADRAALLDANEMDGPVFKIANDPRITPLGRFLRRTSLDELPQLLNVLAGHMSLVGPRPLPLLETRELTGSDRRRLSMRPGLTCLWQVSGRNDLTFREWMALDLQYVDNWSMTLDLAILVRTIPALLSARGAR
ncbi:MAG TPA: exopolysaccharide biosynthesis polyprenyl glycosylphosphotransferase [Thermoanaerobaculia bacterium]|nr:exopolysaccharide biosynthesis polyprenyl glycosylphosphotransferase [Thermoanaerobaculia bacterium]